MFDRLIAQWKVRQLIRSWSELRLAVTQGGDPNVPPSADESHFLRLKARIASLLPVLNLPGPQGPEAQAHARAITDMLNQTKPLPVDAVAARDEFERRWLEHFVYLNQVRGLPLASPGPRRARGVPTGIPERRMPFTIPGSASLGFLFRAGVVTFAIYLLGRAFGFRWSSIAPATATVKGGTTTAPGTAPNLSSVPSELSNAAQAVSHSVSEFFRPVFESYGTNVALILFGILLVALGYWFFVRRS